MNQIMVKKQNSKTAQKTLVLLDAHAILHRAYHALPDFESTTGEPTGALFGLCTLLLKLIKDFKPDYIAGCFDLPEPTERHLVYKEYKAGRAKTDDALIQQLERAKDVCKSFNIPIYSSPGFEADDMLGTIVEQTKDNKNLNIVIASGDMDTLQLVKDEQVRVYTLKKGIKDTIIYNEEAVVERFGFVPDLLPDYKGLRGDPSDNIIGIKGIGEKTAEILIQNFGTLEEMFKILKKNPEKFKAAGISEKMTEKLVGGVDDALFSKMLATIRRDAPIHFVLPDSEWIPGVDQGKIVELINELDFRSLKNKVAEAFDFTITEENTEADPVKLKVAGLMFWVIDSNKPNATTDDILSYTKTKNIDDAKKVLEKIINDQGLTFVWEKIEEPLIPILEKMHQIGVKIDVEFLADLSKKYHKKLETLEKKIWELAGEEFNIASPKQLGVVLFEKMGLKVKNQKKNASGGFSTKESELEKLREDHEIAGFILEYRELAKLLGTYIDTIPTLVDPQNRLHTTFLQNGAVTGRMASQNPGLQNIPNKTDLGREIRKAFIAEPGNVLLSIDYSQIELRIGAFLSGDKKLIEIFNNDEDIHTAVASEVFGVAKSEVTKEMRGKAKTINFGVMYGMGATALKTNLKSSREEAEEFLTHYFTRFSGLSEYLERIKRETAQKGFTETFHGRRRYFPDINSKLGFLKAQAERMAINAPIQGTEADIIKLAMIEIDKYITDHKLDSKIKMLLQVHDELVFEVEEGSVKFLAPVMQKIMENIIAPKDTVGIICKTEASYGGNWVDTQKINY